MRTSSYRVVFFIAAMALAACSAGTSTPATPFANLPASALRLPQGWPTDDKARKPILFIADLQGNVVRMYDPNTPNPPAEGTITDGVFGPQGIAVDSKGALYVSNVGYPKSTITVYAPGQSKPKLTIPGPGYYGLAVNSKGDIFGTFTGGTVSGYRPGAKKPYETIGGFVNPNGIAVDAKDNVWVADDTANKVSIIPAGTKTPKDSGLQELNSPIGLSFGAGDTLYVANFGLYNVAVYKSGSKKPAYTITDGITGPTLNGITAANIFFQSNELHNVVGYQKGKRAPFSTIVGNSDPLGIASSPLVKK